MDGECTQGTVADALDIALQAHALSKLYPVRSGWFGGNKTLRALNGVSLSLERGRTLGVVGESGCGKSTLARQLTMVETPTDGRLVIDGRTISENGKRLSNTQDADLRRRVQMVFQNPYASLNPRKTIEQALGEPLRINTDLSATDRLSRIRDMMQTVGLRPEHLRRYPHMFSGGQRQRIAIARAMIVEPSIVVADEPTSALDVSVQAQILNLFLDLQEQFRTSYVFISHNLSVIEHVAHDMMVMYLGAVVETGEKSRIFSRARHPYTRVLMSATPALRAENRRDRIAIEGELPSPLAPPPGCTFHRRCPYAVERCRSEVPILRPVDGRQVACHRAEEIA
ncbi:peptide ABC transporter ATP-binding protein [Robbsia andropogonis]|uniref:Peptide ABC transporter ATP-binding protein n=1 Tax=Robbsia andropogonis TaxID=28092 RepID=A0A0F5K4H1_9BURK|nr:peptide ABC transporter ATP-binding protein [Robbsia andropogonis]